MTSLLRAAFSLVAALVLAVLDGMVRTLAGGLFLGLWLLREVLTVLNEAQARWVPAPVEAERWDW